MKVKEFMTTKIEYVDAGGSLYDAVEKMVDKRIRSLAVRFPGNEMDVGVITARDVVFKVLARGLDPKDVKAGDIASRPVICIDQDTDLSEAARIMEESKVARLFICDKDGIIGIVALLDVMWATLIKRARGNHVS
jgi:CBS domain-containing protein